VLVVVGLAQRLRFHGYHGPAQSYGWQA